MPSPKTNHSMINLNDEYILIKGEKWYKYIRIQSKKKLVHIVLDKNLWENIIYHLIKKINL